MPHSVGFDPIIDRPLDPKAAARVPKPGIGVIITPQCNMEVIFREAQNVAQVRDRILYAIIVHDEVESIGVPMQEWEERTHLFTHSVGVDRVKISTATLQKDLHEYCRQFDIRLLIIEQRSRTRWYRPFANSLAEKVSSSQILPPTFVLKNLQDTSKKGKKRLSDWWILAIALLAAGFLASIIDRQFTQTSQLLVYVLALALIAPRVTRVVSVVGSFIVMLQFNFFHEGGVASFSFDNPEVWLNLVGLLIVTLIIGTLSWQLQTALAETQIQERRKTAFFHLTRDLLRTPGLQKMVSLLESHIKDVVDADIALFLNRNGEFATYQPDEEPIKVHVDDDKARATTLANGVEAGNGTRFYPLARGLYLPIKISNEVAGCIGVYPTGGKSTIPAEQLRVLDTFVSLASISLERVAMEEAQDQAETKVRETNLQNTLLRSVSHDLKTPLTSITGFANQLVEDPDLPVEVRVSTYTTIRDEAWRLTNLVNNLLAMTKLESEAIQLNKETMFVEELIGTAVSQLRNRTSEHQIKIDVPADIADVDVDPLLMNQALVNLIENAVKYAPHNTTIEVRARNISTGIQISVLDNGPGLPKDSMKKVFEKFTRFGEGRWVEGTGLGLAIVKAIVELHGGKAIARNRSTQGARFDLKLPAVKAAELKESIS